MPIAGLFVGSIFGRTRAFTQPLQAAIPVVTPPPMASHCIRADAGLQQKIPLGALVLGLGRRTASLPRRLRRRLSDGSSRDFSTIASYTAGSTARSLVGGGGERWPKKCVSCGRPGVRRQESQQHARLLIQRGVSGAEAKKPRCLRCVQQLLATVSAAALKRRLRNENATKRC